MTERGRRHDDDGLHARIGNHRPIIVVHRHGSPGIRSSAAFSAHCRESEIRKIVEQVLEVSTAMATDANQAYPQWCRRW
jgi:hypothetical protein